MCKFLRNFAADMKKHAYIFLLLTLFALCAHAETLLLRTGARVKGTVVFQNEDVIVIRNAEGARHQFPRTDVKEVLPDAEIPETQDTVVVEEPEITTPKKVSILLELGAGAAVIPNENKLGVGYGVDLLVGSHHIGSRHIFVGGGLGYHGMVIGKTYNFLPVQVAVRMPLMETKHAPVFGLGVGYGVALSKEYLGGLYAGLDFGYRCQFNPKSALALVVYARFQQATVSITEEPFGIGSSDADPELGFVNRVGRSFVNAGIKFALYF